MWDASCGWCGMGALILGIAAAVIWVLLSGLVGKFAEKKGHDGDLWFWFSLLCSPAIGYFFVAILPSSTGLIRTSKFLRHKAGATHH
jgi:hypothetical protein